MNIYFITVAFTYIISDFVALSQSPKDGQQIATAEMAASDPTPDTLETNPNLKSLWVYRPPSLQSQQTLEQLSHRVVLRPPHLLTRLAKPLAYGFDPFFHKAYFEPFERRQRPVTLIEFRKNGLVPRKMVDPSNRESAEVAELQSAFNDISTFWKDDGRLIN